MKNKIYEHLSVLKIEDKNFSRDVIIKQSTFLLEQYKNNETLNEYANKKILESRDFLLEHFDSIKLILKQQSHKDGLLIYPRLAEQLIAKKISEKKSEEERIEREKEKAVRIELLRKENEKIEKIKVWASEKIRDDFNQIKADDYSKENYNKIIIEKNNGISKIESSKSIDRIFEIKSYTINAMHKVKTNIQIKKKKRVIKICITSLSLFFTLIITGILLTTLIFIPNKKYNSALKYIENGDYEYAVEELSTIKWKNSKQLLSLSSTMIDFEENNNYETVINSFVTLGYNVNVSFDANGGEGISDLVINSNNYSFVSPEKNGFVFIGWSYESYNLDLSNQECPITLYMKASYRFGIYKIEYDFNGGRYPSNLILPQSYDITDFTKIEDPLKSGYTFLGWKVNGGEVIKSFSISEGSYGDIFLEAMWEPNAYKIYYDANGGFLEDTTQEVPFNEAFGLSTPQRNGYQFAGWYHEGKLFTANESWDYLEDIRLVARWTISEYDIIYNLGDGINNQENPSSYTVEDGFLIHEPHKHGYTFLGWSFNGSDEMLESITIDKGTTGDILLVALWKENQHTITFDTNGGEELLCIGANTGETYSLPVPIKSGYIFSGWYLDGMVFKSHGYWDLEEDITLIAHWTTNDFRINYYLNGGTNSNLNPETFETGEYMTFDEPTRKGYTFTGWTGTYISNPTLEYQLTNECTDIDLVANWEINTYKIRFYSTLNGQEEICQEQQVIFNEYFSLPNPTKTGYTFLGWFYNSKEYFSGKYEYDYNLDLTAYWTANTNTPYTINYYFENINNEGFSYGYSETEYGTSDFEKMLYPKEISGFITPNSQTIVVKADGKTTVDLYYYRNRYLVTFVYNSGEIKNSDNYKYGDTLSNVIPIRENFEFGGWYLNPELDSAFEYVKNEVTVYAHWKEETKPYLFNYSVSNEQITIDGYLSITPASVSFPKYINDCLVTKIKSNAFKDAVNIISIKLPDSIVSIGNSAFSGCNLLETFDFNDCKVEALNDKTFYNCIKLKELYIPDSVLNIGEDLLNGCSSIQKLRIPFVGSSATDASPSGKRVFGYIFGETAFSKATYTKQCYYYDKYSYSNYNAYYYIPNSLVEVSVGTKINFGSFNGCNNIQIIIIEASVKSINGYAFRGCNNLKFIFNNSEFILTNGDDEISSTVKVCNKNEWGYIDGVPTPNL